MAKHSSNASSMATAFHTLRLDGMRMSRGQLIDRCEALLKQEPEKNAWLQDVLDTLLNLGRETGLPATTSGTTGPPKHFDIPHRDLLASAALTAQTFDLKAGDRVLHCLPSAFIAGKMMLVRAFASGLDLHLADPRGSVLDKLDPDDRFAFAAMIPLQLSRALAEDRARVERQFRTILLGGGPLSNALIDEVQSLSTQVFIGYGSTETLTHVALRALNGNDKSDAFTALGDVHFARDPRGCLVVYTPHLSVQQHVTNDLVELIDDTHFRWLGRYDNVILSGGKKIFPEQLEARTASLIPYPHYFSATADSVLGQAVTLTLESDRPQGEVIPEVMDLLIGALSAHEMPRRIIVLPRIERTGSGKMKRGNSPE